MNDLVQNNNETVPGVGVAGQVMCPFSLMAPKMCLKQGCELWIELKYGDKMVGRCALNWLPILMIETRQAIERLTNETQN